MEVREVAQIFYQTIFKLYDLSEVTVFDWGLQFTSEFSKHLTNQLGIDSKLSTFFHPKINELIKQTNAVIKQYLDHFCNYY